MGRGDRCVKILDLNSIFLLRKDYVLTYKTLLISSPAS